MVVHKIKKGYVWIPISGNLGTTIVITVLYQNTDMYKVKPPQVSGIINGGQYVSPWWLTMLESNNKAKNI